MEKNNFYVCRDCGNTLFYKRMPKDCEYCKSKDLGKLKIDFRLE